MRVIPSLTSYIRARVGICLVLAIIPASSACRALADVPSVPNLVGERVAIAEQRCRLAGFRLLNGAYFVAPQFWRDDLDESLVALQWTARGEDNSGRFVACWTLRKGADEQPVVTVPAIVGSPRSVGAAQLQSWGLAAMEAGDGGGGDPLIARCFPAPGTSVYQGTAVVVEFENGSPIADRPTSEQAATDTEAPQSAPPATQGVLLAAKTVAAESSVDWTAGTVTVVIPLELTAAPVTFRLPGADDAAMRDLILKRVDRGLSVTGPTFALREVIEPGTRSLRLETAPADAGIDDASKDRDAAPAQLTHYQADLPAIDVVKATKQVGDETVGPTLSLRVAHLTPDFRIEAAVTRETEPDDETAEANPRYRPIRADAFVPGGVRITRAEPDGAQGVRIDLELPQLAGESVRRYRFAVVDAFGSRTRSLEVRQQGSDIVDGLQMFLPAIAAPLDELVVVPRLELLEFAAAAEAAQAAGLVPVPFLADRQEYGGTALGGARLVVAQGAVAGRRIRRGELLLLAVETEDGSRRTEAAGREVSPSPPAAGDPFGFVAVPHPVSMLHGPEETDDEDASTLAAGLSVAGASETDTSPPANDAPAGNRPAVDEGTLPLDAASLIPLDPRIDAGEAEARASLRAIVDAVTSRLDQEEPPGVAGRFFGDVVRDHDESLSARDTDASRREAAVSAITDQVAEQFQVNLSADERSRLVTACTAAHATSAAGSGSARHELDRNGNGFVADDVAAWLLARLVEQKRLAPTALGRVEPSALGSPVAVLTSRPGTAPSGKPPASTTPAVADQEIKIPSGKPVVARETLPTKVRIPSLDERPLDGYVRRLNELGLQIAKNGKLFAKDKLLGTTPAQREWVPPATAISLEIERLVPDVTTLKAQEAVDALREKELAVTLSQPDRKYRNGDVVATQSPEAGEYRPRNTKIELTLKRPVPRVVGSKASEAIALLKRQEFKILGPDPTLDDDLVAEQSPAPGTPAEIGAEVTLLRLSTTMPDLTGGTLAKAKTLEESQKLLAERRLKFTLVEPQTDYARARVVAQSPKFGTAVDREKQEAQLTMVIPVPEPSERITVAAAAAALKSRTLGYAVTSGKSKAEDFVMRLDVAKDARKFTVENHAYVFPGTQIVMTVGREVPRVDDRPWSDGLSTVGESGFEFAAPLGTGTHVYSTEPAGGALADLRYPVKVYAGIKIPSVAGQEWPAAERQLADLDLRLVASATVDVETDETGLIGTRRVADDAGQSPAAGKIIRKGSTRDVSVRALRYVERRVKVPPVIDLTAVEAGARIEGRGLVFRSTVVAQATTDPALNGRELVTFQNPAAETLVPKGSTVVIRVTRWTYNERPLTTYALDRGPELSSLVTCVLSADRKTVAITSRTLGSSAAPATMTGKLENDQVVFRDKRCPSYSVELPRRNWGLRIPFDGNGPGQSLVNGEWVHQAAGHNPLIFSTTDPTASFK